MTRSEPATTEPGKSAKDLNVNMSNALVRAAHGLSLAEKRVVSVCIAKMDSVNPVEGCYRFKLAAGEYAETYEVDIDTAYEQMRYAGDHLMKRIARTFEESRQGKFTEYKWVWVSAAVYYHGEGLIELEFSRQMTPHLTLLRQQFTSYKLKQASALRSLYSWRLLELLMQFKSTGLLHISTEEFCHAMEVPESAIKNFAQLRKRVIEPAVKELADKDGMSIAWEAKKRGGRKITSLEFTFEKQAPRQAAQATPQARPLAVRKSAKPVGKAIYGVSIADIERLAYPGESWEGAAARIAERRKRGAA